ncbi:polysaccharide biosynthesis tyrosine autokinase [Paraburkholderia sediminicola]|uniref:polysaccharide biosynthesis tyrosine autokinase n=1 Tax=Paraburkholderia sediminicola TaxID=458836 RepID=UPI0038BD7149
MKNERKRERQENSEKSSAFDFASIFDILFVSRWLVLCTLALFVAGGAAYAFLARPVYQARILVQVEDTGDAPNASPAEFVGDVSSIIGARSTSDGEIQILGSKRVLSETVDVLQLNVSAQPHYFPLIGRSIAHHRESLPDLGIPQFGDFAWGDESISIARFDVPKSLDNANYSLKNLGNGFYEISGKGLEGAQRGRIGVVDQFETREGPIQLEVKAIYAGPRVAFNLVHRSRQQTINALQASLQIVEQGNKSNILSATLTGDDPVLLSNTLNEIGKQYLKQNAERSANLAAKSLAFLNTQLPEMRKEVEQAENNYNAYRAAHASVDMDEQGKLLLKQSSDAKTALYQLRQHKVEVASIFANNSAQLMTVDAQIRATQTQLDSVTQQIKDLPGAEQEALRLMREVRVSTDLYASLRSNMEHLQLLSAGKIGSVRVVDNADVPEIPIKPRREFILAAAGVIGLFAGVGLAFVRSMMGKGVVDPQELEATGLNVYGSILYSTRQAKMELDATSKKVLPGLLAAVYPKDPAVESMRVLRTALQVALLGARNNVIMLTGPMPRIGKSFTSANFAAVLASGGKRVLLVDADLRKGHLHSYLGLPKERGIAEVMSGSLQLKDAIRRSVVPNLDFLGTGAYPENAAELLLKGNIRKMIESVSPLYDIVLIDSAAALAVSDVGIVAPAAGCIFIVARYGVTRISEMSEAVNRLKQAGCRVHGVFLNGVPQGGGGYAFAKKYGTQAYTQYYDSRET